MYPLGLCFSASWEPSSWFRSSWPHLSVVPSSCPSWAKLPFLFFSKRHPTHLNHSVNHTWVWYGEMARELFQDNWNTAPYKNININTKINEMYCLILAPYLGINRAGWIYSWRPPKVWAQLSNCCCCWHFWDVRKMAGLFSLMSEREIEVCEDTPWSGRRIRDCWMFLLSWCEEQHKTNS